MQDFDESRPDDDFGAVVLSLKDYLRSVCPNLVPMKGQGIDVFDDLLATQDVSECLLKFVSGSENEALYVIATDSGDDRGIYMRTLLYQLIASSSNSIYVCQSFFEFFSSSSVCCGRRFLRCVHQDSTGNDL